MSHADEMAVRELETMKLEIQVDLARERRKLQTAPTQYQRNVIEDLTRRIDALQHAIDALS